MNSRYSRASTGAVDASSEVLSTLSKRVQSLALKLNSGSADLARSISSRFHSIGGTITGDCTLSRGDEVKDMMLPLDHKDFLDAVRRRHPELYKVLAEAGAEFAKEKLSNQVVFLQATMPAFLGEVQKNKALFEGYVSDPPPKAKKA